MLSPNFWDLTTMIQEKVENGLDFVLKYHYIVRIDTLSLQLLLAA
jgi:hypothetical protein